MSSRTVYAVEHGDYSDRRTECLFDTKEQAEAYIAALEATHKDFNEKNPDGYLYPNEWYIQEYQLWSHVPVVGWKADEFHDRYTLDGAEVEL